MSNLNHGEIKDSNLLQEHRDLVESYLNNETKLELEAKNKILKLYDHYLHKDNIRYYINQHVKVLIVHIAQGQVKKAAKYFPKGYLEDENTI
ncbi:MAG: hypothetical protein CL596_05140 [Alteromonas sp.]|nr:hypothetical protein [Alteromonas sp.]|tara:strand:- start:18432 stop:18707 length:276 start_codon:yes stop_codon:yes gene_type:complete